MLTDTYIQISAQDWMDWKSSPATQEVFRVLNMERTEWAERLLFGDTLDSLAETGKAVGTVYGIDCILLGIEEVLRLQWEAMKKKEMEETDGNK